MTTTSPSVLENARIMITGASSGIGEAIARQVAPTARELVLVARRADRLRALETELTAAHPALRVDVKPCDLGDPTALAALASSALETGPVDVLVNNAGFGDESLFDRSEWDTQRRMIEVNVLAAVQLTHLILPGMISRNRGAIMFTGSGAGHVFMPKAAVYAGTKHFIDGFVESLRIDLADTAVTVTQVAPGPVTTEFDAVAGVDGHMAGAPPAHMTISAEECAREAVAALDRGRPLVFPGRTFRALMGVADLLPRPIKRAMFARAGRGLRAA